MFGASSGSDVGRCVAVNIRCNVPRFQRTIAADCSAARPVVTMATVCGCVRTRSFVTMDGLLDLDANTAACDIKHRLHDPVQFSVALAWKGAAVRPLNVFSRSAPCCVSTFTPCFVPQHLLFLPACPFSVEACVKLSPIRVLRGCVRFCSPVLKVVYFERY